MFIKPFKIPLHILQLQVLLRRFSGDTLQKDEREKQLKSYLTAKEKPPLPIRSAFFRKKNS